MENKEKIIIDALSVQLREYSERHKLLYGRFKNVPDNYSSKAEFKKCLIGLGNRIGELSILIGEIKNGQICLIEKQKEKLK